MSHIDLVRLLIRIIDAFENVLVPQSMRCAAALYCAVRNLPEKLEFLCLAALPWYERLIRRPAAWLRSASTVLGRIRHQMPGWSVRLLKWLRRTLVDALVIGGGVALLVLLWLNVFGFC